MSIYGSCFYQVSIDTQDQRDAELSDKSSCPLHNAVISHGKQTYGNFLIRDHKRTNLELASIHFKFFVF